MVDIHILVVEHILVAGHILLDLLADSHIGLGGHMNIVLIKLLQPMVMTLK